jgi:maltose alpha-D-glucosyltransferase/alpha-amylase
MPDFVTFVLRGGPDEMITPQYRREFEANILPAYLVKRRWFATKDQQLTSVRVAFTARFGAGKETALVAVEADHPKGTDRYLLPLGIDWDDQVSAALPQQLALARVRRGRRMGYLTDAFTLPGFIHDLLGLLKQGGSVKSTTGEVSFRPTPAFDAITVAPEDPVRWLSAEQSNSSVIVDHKLMLKLFRRLAPGQHPEAEMTRVLTERGFANAPALLGEIVHVPEAGEEEVMAVVQAFIPGEGDAWEWTMSYLGRSLDEMAREDHELHDLLATYDTFSRTLGRRLGEMHVVLAQDSADEAFRPVRAGSDQVERWLRRITARIENACEGLERHRETLAPEDQAMADAVLARREALLALVTQLCGDGKGALLHRVHGDFHLGQVLVASGDVMIIDFEGEPAQPLAERRAKDSGWRDVAGILRSLDYAIASGRRLGAAAGREERYDTLAARFRAAMPAALVEAYREAVGAAQGEDETALLDLFMIEKAAYEIGYEVSNRPDWLAVPLLGLTQLLDRLLPGKDTA